MPFLSPGDLPDPGIELRSSALQEDIYIYIYTYIYMKKIRLPVKETQETWVPSLGQEDPLEKEIAICFSILA